jgi:hypothetical protein
MKSLPLSVAAVCAASVLAAPALAGPSNTFSTNPLQDASVLGPGAGNVNSRFTYNDADGTLTAHYDSSQPTIKLVFPLGRHVTQNDSFSVSTTFKVLSDGYTTPPDFSSAAPSFGFINTSSTGDLRAATQDANYATVTDGTAYNIMTVDYYPVIPNMYGGNSFDISVVQSPQPGVDFYHSVAFAYSGFDMPMDQFVTAQLSYDAVTQEATLTYDGTPVVKPLGGKVFDMDAFAILLWSDPNVAAAAPAVPYGQYVHGDVVFDSFNVNVVPEPASLAWMACGAALWAGRRFRRGNRA